MDCSPFGYNVRWGLTRQASEATSYGQAEFMALLSDLVRIVAAVEGLEEVSVGIFARQAREAGLIAQGGRGRSAAKMSTVDAANLLIAVNGCHLAKDVSTRVPKLRDLPLVAKSPKASLGIGASDSSFGVNLERLISFFQTREGDQQLTGVFGETYIRFFKPHLMVDVEFVPTGRVVAGKVQFRFWHKASEYTEDSPDRHDEAVISHVTLRAVARAL